MNSRLHLYRRITEGGTFSADLTRHLPDWQDESRAAGGFWTGHGSIAETMSRLELVDLFQTGLGRIIKRLAFGCVGWEGLIYELRLTIAGIQYVRSLTPELWHNRVRVYYTERRGEEMKTAWAQDAASVAQYGECEYIVTLGTASTETANRFLARHIAEYAWPRTRMAGATQATPSRAPNQPDSLEVFAAGFWSTLNWRYADDIVPDGEEHFCAAEVQLLVSRAQFVTAGRIEDVEPTRRVWVRFEPEPPQRLGDLVLLVAGHGDYAGNTWQAGVYADQQLIYEQAPDTARYVWRQGQLCTLAGQPACLDLLRPGFLLLNADAPALGLPAGVVAERDDPRVAYVDSILYSTPGAVRLGVQETGGAAEMILEQVATGGRIMAVVQERIATARQEMQDAMRRDYAKREREYVSKELWEDYTSLTGHEWQGQYDESPE